MALAGPDTSSLVKILQAHFGHVNPLEYVEEDVSIEEEKASGTSEDVSVKSQEGGHLATAELIFPFQSIQLVMQAFLKIIYLFMTQNHILLPLSSPPMYPSFCPKGFHL